MSGHASHLSADHLQELRAELERELSKLERSMGVTDEALRPVELDRTAVGRLSRIYALQNQGLTKNLREREHLKLGLLVEALHRMDAGTYGRCVTCGAGIAFERLFVMPEAPSCARCP